jgi:hypothetical protein
MNPQIETQIMTIGPEQARALLNNAAPNRPLREALLTQYALDMANGHWGQTGESIKIDTEGRVIDGQHRLHAIIKAGVLLQLLVVSGLENASQDAMDQGGRRTLSDQLARRGYKNCNALAAGIAVAHAWEVTGKPQSRSDSKRNHLQWFMEHQELQESVESVRKVWQSPLRYPSGYAIAIHYRMAKFSRIDADFFWEVLASGKFEYGAEPIRLLREKCLEASAQKAANGRSLDPTQRAAFTIKAWNAWITGKTISILRFKPSSGETFPTLIDPEGF